MVWGRVQEGEGRERREPTGKAELSFLMGGGGEMWLGKVIGWKWGRGIAGTWEFAARNTTSQNQSAAQWWRACLASTKPWAQSPAPHKHAHPCHPQEAQVWLTGQDLCEEGEGNAGGRGGVNRLAPVKVERACLWDVWDCRQSHHFASGSRCYWRFQLAHFLQGSLIPAEPLDSVTHWKKSPYILR